MNKVKELRIPLDGYFCFDLDEVNLILDLLKMKKDYSTDKELPMVESLISDFTKAKSELEENERRKAYL